MFGIGIPEFILILIVGLIVFGPSKLPEVGRAVGKAMREFKKASHALSAAINEPDDPPTKPAPTATTVSTETAAVASYAPPTQETVRAELTAKQQQTGQSDNDIKINRAVTNDKI